VVRFSLFDGPVAGTPNIPFYPCIRSWRRWA
jgi:hypothetical protein